MSWKIDPTSRDYAVDTQGKPVEDTTLKTPAYIRLITPRAGWMYAPDKKYGSNLHLIKKNSTASDDKRISNTAQTALDPIVDDGRAVDIGVDLVGSNRNNAAVQITITDRKGNEEKTDVIPVGG